MGWSFGWRSKKELVDYLVKGSSVTHKVVGNCLWSINKHEKGNYIALYLIDKYNKEYGYKDICHNWVIDRWKPEELMDLYVEMGARFFMAMGSHHDNFDCYDSKYQPWN